MWDLEFGIWDLGFGIWGMGKNEVKRRTRTLNPGYFHVAKGGPDWKAGGPGPVWLIRIPLFGVRVN